MRFLILAGGLGMRMRPISVSVPKPLIAYKKKPLLEHILERLSFHKIDDITISLGYGADLIRAYCKVKNWNVNFIEETTPLGTAGPLSLFDFKEKTAIITNGDIITDMDFGLLENIHLNGGYDITVVCKQYEDKLNLGTIETEGKSFKRIVERPTFKYLINCGIYAVNPCMKDRISKLPIDFPELINSTGINVGLFNLGNYGFNWQAIESLDQLEEE